MVRRREEEDREDERVGKDHKGCSVKELLTHYERLRCEDEMAEELLSHQICLFRMLSLRHLMETGQGDEMGLANDSQTGKANRPLPGELVILVSV